MNSQPWTLSPSAEKGPTLYQGSHKETRTAKVAGPAIRSLAFRAFRRCRDLLARFGAGRGMTYGVMAAPHLGQRWQSPGTPQPGDGSKRASNLLPAVKDACSGYKPNPGCDLSIRIRFNFHPRAIKSSLATEVRPEHERRTSSLDCRYSIHRPVIPLGSPEGRSVWGSAARSITFPAAP